MVILQLIYLKQGQRNHAGSRFKKYTIYTYIFDAIIFKFPSRQKIDCDNVTRSILFTKNTFFMVSAKNYFEDHVGRFDFSNI